MQKDRVIFLSSKYPYSKKDWSGIPFFLNQSLSEVYEVEHVSLPKFKFLKRLGHYANRIVVLVTQKKYVFDYGIVMAVLYGFTGSWKLRNRRGIKFIFSPAGLTETAFIKSDIPIVTYGDCSALQLIDYYPELKGVCALSRWEIRAVERNAFKRSSVSIFSSVWACDFVKREFSKTCKSIPFGSNISYSLEVHKPKSLNDQVCNLLFIGVDWMRKGGDTLLKIHEGLIQKGVNSRLTIVGTSIPDECAVPAEVSVIAHLDKSKKEGETIFRSLLEDASFFLLPTLADCTPVVIAEAYSFGLPVLATNTGGISSMVFENVTGFLFKEGDVDGYVNKIIYLLNNDLVYSQISERCLAYHQSTFNWKAWVTSFNEIISPILTDDNK